VRGGPNSEYASIGSIGNQEIVSYLSLERGFAYIEYSTVNGAKRGYVSENLLANAIPPTLPSLTTYTNFTPGTYGTSALGQPLKYYEIGNGINRTNVAFIIFGLHGWEDAWAFDGIELVNIANSVMSNLSVTNQSVFSGWTVYIIPYANPDGMVNGYTANGPGRSAVTTQVDLNRCWPSNFVPSYRSRDYTGDLPMGAPEAQELMDFITENFSTGHKVVLDVHGWLNKTYGDSDIGLYFDQQFGFSHSSSYGSGYLISWAKSIGAKTSLIELPMPSSAGAIVSNNYAGKLSSGIIDMLNGQSSGVEGGTEVNELVKIFSTGSVNVRSGPTTSASVVTTLNNGEIVTRIRTGVAVANGYTWDKIQLDNGTIGYIATNFLVLYNPLTTTEIETVKAYLKYNKINDYTGAINSNYDNNTILAVKELQRILELPRTGYVDTNTWNAMEFNNINIYNLYTQYANNYKTHGDPYGKMIETIIQGGQEVSKYIKYKQSSDVDSIAAAEIIEGEEEFFARDLNDIYMNLLELASISDRLDFLIAISPILSDANGNLVYYTDVTANKHMHHNNISGLMFLPETMSAIVALEDECLVVAESMANANECNFNFALEEQKVIIPQMLNLGDSFNDVLAFYVTSIPRLNWFLAYGSYRIDLNCKVERNNNRFKMTMTYDMQDYYNWDKNNQNPFFGIIAPYELWLLHYSGLARNYHQNGKIIRVLEWQAGNSSSALVTSEYYE